MLEFGFKDVLDVVLVALLLFYLYRLMRESSSVNIFTGVLVFIVVWLFVSQVLEMRLLGGILDRLVNVGALSIIVLFQAEIRHFFSSIGRQRATVLFKWMRRDKENDASREIIMPIVRACLNMGRQKVGALIVVEGLGSLQDEINTGESIDAKISQRLIETVFFKNSPLHDGAMVISKGGIKAAACLLPVSHDDNIQKNLGLRHRSGLGITQKTDCLAIIVSEETGTISVAYKGTLTLRLTSEDLEQRLASIIELW